MREIFLVLSILTVAVSGYQVNFVGYQQSDQPIELLIKKFNKCGKNAYYDIFTSQCNNCSQCNKNEFVVDACTVFDDTVCSTCADQTFVNTFAYRSNCGKFRAIKYHDGVVRPFPLFDPDRVRILPNARPLVKEEDIPDENSIVVESPRLSESRRRYEDDEDDEYDSDEDEYFESRIGPLNRKTRPESLVPMSAEDDDDDFDSNSIESESDEDTIAEDKMINSERIESAEEDNTISDEDNAELDDSISEESQNDEGDSDEDDESDEQIVEIGSLAMKIAPKYRALLERKNDFKKSGEIHDVSDIIRDFPYGRNDLLSDKDTEEDSESESQSDEASDEAEVDDLIRTIEIRYEAESQLDDDDNTGISKYKANLILLLLYSLGAMAVLVAFCWIRRARNTNRTYIVTPPSMTPEDKKNIIRAFDHIKKSRRGQFKYQPIEEFV